MNSQEENQVFFLETPQGNIDNAIYISCALYSLIGQRYAMFKETDPEFYESLRPTIDRLCYLCAKILADSSLGDKNIDEIMCVFCAFIIESSEFFGVKAVWDNLYPMVGMNLGQLIRNIFIWAKCPIQCGRIDEQRKWNITVSDLQEIYGLH